MALKYFNVISGISAGNITINAANNTVVANEFVGNVTGAVLTSAQPNITSVGTLSSLNVSGNISIADRIIHTDDTDTSIRFPAADTFTVETAGNERMRIDSAGDIGIGTTSPSAKLTSVANFGNGTSVNFNSVPLGTAQGQISGYSFRATFEGTADNGPRRSADIWSGYNGGTWGNEYLAFGVGIGVQNDVAAQTIERVRITGAGGVGIGNIAPAHTLSVNGNIFANTGIQVTSLTTGANTTAGTVTGNWTLTAGSRWQSTYADLAERYVADNAYEPGTVVVLGGENEVTIETVADSHKVAGVITTNPAYIMNSELQGDDVVEVALIGRVPCKVVGPISKGDLLTSAEIAGYAHANNNATAGRIVGKSLENFDGETGVIEIMVGKT